MKITLSIDDSKARKLYNAGCGAVKTLLEESFERGFFENRKITDIVKTYEDACMVLHIDSDIIERQNSCLLRNGYSPLSKSVVAYMKLRTIIEALNEGWNPNWDDSIEMKYCPYFNMSPSSFAFDGSVCGFSFAYAGCGSSLCLKSKELSHYCGRQFLDLWKEFIL